MKNLCSRTQCKNLLFKSVLGHCPVNLHPLFLKIGHPAFWKKQSAKNQGHCYVKREEAAWSLFFLNKEWPCFFQPDFCKKQGAQIFKKQGARFLRIVGADWQPRTATDLDWIKFRLRGQIGKKEIVFFLKLHKNIDKFIGTYLIPKTK